MEVKIYTSFKDRLFGLMFKKNINHGVCFPNCNSVHTFFMKEEIDIVMTGPDKEILYIFENVPPNKIIGPKKGVHFTYEFPKNTLHNNNNVRDLLI